MCLFPVANDGDNNKDCEDDGWMDGWLVPCGMCVCVFFYFFFLLLLLLLIFVANVHTYRFVTWGNKVLSSGHSIQLP
jgi:hypothetical protein